MVIIGAGLAGLLAGNIFQRATILEAGDEKQLTHRAVLRFRSRAVGDAVGIDFRPVTVHKGIWLEGKFVRPSIQLANLYSQKVIGKLQDRSIWRMEPVERFIAPENIVEQLAERCVGRIRWNHKVEAWKEVNTQGGAPIISTMPMPLLHKLLPLNAWKAPRFEFLPIVVKRWRIPSADVFQTIYFPSPRTTLYRASITGSLLIAEYIRIASEQDDLTLMEAFGVARMQTIDATTQRYGKIAAVDEAWRRNFILRCTLDHGVFALGRFATWRNILLDDVLKDISVIKRLISGGAYDAARTA